MLDDAGPPPVEVGREVVLELPVRQPSRIISLHCIVVAWFCLIPLHCASDVLGALSTYEIVLAILK